MSEKIATPIIQPRIYFSKDAKPLVGGKVYAFKIGENEFKPTFRNAELTALNQNPIVLDQAGSCLIYMKGAVRLQVFDKNNVFIEERVVYQQRQIAQFFDKYGKALSFGKVQTLDYQSTIKKASYKNSDLNQNPVLLDENGCAEISIAGAYRLRSYNKSGVFIADQDFKRLPARALTSRPYPIYFEDNVSTGFVANESAQKISLIVSNVTEASAVSFNLNNIVIGEPLTTIDIEVEQIAALFSLDSALIRSAINTVTISSEETATNFSILNVDANTVLIRNTARIEATATQFSVIDAQITN